MASSSNDSSLSSEAAEMDEEDAFLGFVETARSMLSSSEDEGKDGGGPPWGWIVSRILKSCAAYSSGVTAAILLSDLFQAWNEQNRYMSFKRKFDGTIPFKDWTRRRKLPNTITIDSLYEKNFLSSNSVLEAVILDSFFLPGTTIYMLNLGDKWSSSTIDLYMHRRYYHLIDSDNRILKKGREIFLTGCRLRTALEGNGRHRLLPTEYMVILLEEDQDDDAMLLLARFYSDSFSTTPPDTGKDSFYARVESIGPLDVEGAFGSSQRKQIHLVDSDGTKLKFLLWGDQVHLSHLFSVGNMLALDLPFMDESAGGDCQNGGIRCLEYGSATLLYLVPHIQQEEQVILTSTQARYQGSRLASDYDHSQRLKITQVSLPLDYHGSIDLRNYPFRPCISDLHDKMTGICLYGVVASINKEQSITESIFCLRIEDSTGALDVKLHFIKFWSLGRLGQGHMVFMTGLTYSRSEKKLLEASWYEMNPGTSLVNLSCLPALLNSPCLHKISCLSDISSHLNYRHVRSKYRTFTLVI